MKRSWTMILRWFVMKSMLAIILIIIISQLALGQTTNIKNGCDLEFSYKIEDTSEGRENGKILLKLERGDGPYVIKLLDVINYQQGFLQTKEFKTFPSSNYLVVFNNLPPSEYLVRVENKHCKKSISGIEVIQIK